MHVGDDLLQPRHPLPGVIFAGSDQVEIAALAFEDDGEAPIFHRSVRALPQDFGLAPKTHRIDVIDGDCGEDDGEVIRV